MPPEVMVLSHQEGLPPSVQSNVKTYLLRRPSVRHGSWEDFIQHSLGDLWGPVSQLMGTQQEATQQQTRTNTAPAPAQQQARTNTAPAPVPAPQRSPASQAPPHATPTTVPDVPTTRALTDLDQNAQLVDILLQTDVRQPGRNLLVQDLPPISEVDVLFNDISPDNGAPHTDPPEPAPTPQVCYDSTSVDHVIAMFVGPKETKMHQYKQNRTEKGQSHNGSATFKGPTTPLGMDFCQNDWVDGSQVHSLGKWFAVGFLQPLLLNCCWLCCRWTLLVVKKKWTGRTLNATARTQLSGLPPA